MDLSQFFASERGAQARLAKAIEVPAPLLSAWACADPTKRRRVPAERCPAIERATGGLVQCEELHEGPWVRIPDPDWPHPQGRPLRDYAIPKETAHA